MALIPVGLDIGSGFTKVCGNGKTAMFPSLVARACRGGVRRMADMDVVKDDSGGMIEEVVGQDALRVGRSRNGVMVRPIKHGKPYDSRGYALLAAWALKEIGVDPKNAVICAGITYEAQDQRNSVKRILKGLKPHLCAVVPQALGTLVSCGRSEGMVINIGHGTTEIINVRSGGVDGVSIDKASDFVFSQVSRRSDKGAYVEYERILGDNAPAVKRLVSLLSSHIADEAVRMGHAEAVVLAGGGSLIPGMAEALGAALGREITAVKDPVMSNAVGFESKAVGIVGRVAGPVSPD